MKYIICLLLICSSFTSAIAQDKDHLKENSFFVADLSAQEFTAFIKPRIEESQFVFFGEQHGIVEVGEITSLLFDIGRPFGFKTLCIETDAVAANTIAGFFTSENPLEAAIALDKKFHFSIPFYNNSEDLSMFSNVLKSGGTLWGIDQTLMTQIRLNFDHIIQKTTNELLKNKLVPLLKRAEGDFKKAIDEKDFMAPFIFKYDEETHNELLTLSKDKQEKEIFEQLWKTKEIYGYNFSGDYYLNNEVRGRLMKSNFLQYYRKAQKSDPQPRVLFKLGANHAAKGLTRTGIYDIANLGYELALTNKMESLHIIAMGISGFQNRANPFEPEKTIHPIDVSKDIPSDFLELVNSVPEKYLIIDLKALRPVARNFSSDVKDYIFQYDLMILIKEARASGSF